MPHLRAGAPLVALTGPPLPTAEAVGAVAPLRHMVTAAGRLNIGFRSVAANWQQETGNLWPDCDFHCSGVLQHCRGADYAAESPECYGNTPAAFRHAVKT